MTSRLPDAVAAFAQRGPGWDTWVRRLPRLVDDVLGEWRLRPDGAPRSGSTALVLPVTTDDGESAVLKLVGPGWEEEHEPLALQHWGGRGTVQLLRADPRRRLLLLERLHDLDLRDQWDLEACEVVAGLYGRLHRSAPPQLRPLSGAVARWSDRLAALPRDAPLPRRLVEQAVALGRGFATDPATDGVMVHSDLHYENVLAAEREPWLAIDPKPLSGDPHYEPAPMLWNRVEELDAAPGGVRDALRRRFHTLVDVAGLDEQRARDWVVVRMLHNALWELEDHPPGGATTPDRAWLTTCVTVAKAVQD
ncbi:aminoglycoside phosphotransferase family protein [Nocardioides nanhaiensis]|uniref:Streptomycin 6-kinase n=1 Tax=Nocardioides nanhaiensis TaxID=1476871 RepID=A0ABP8WQC4_9ACTN